MASRAAVRTLIPHETPLLSYSRSLTFVRVRVSSLSRLTDGQQQGGYGGQQGGYGQQPGGYQQGGYQQGGYGQGYGGQY